MRKILVVPDPTLRKKSKPVKEVTPDIIALAGDLREMLNSPHGGIIYASVSAPQVGELIRLFVYRDNPFSSVPATTTIINPELVYAKKEITLKEVCLSIPGKEFHVRRCKRVKIRGMGLDGNIRVHKATGIIAQVYQHEMNHLDGVLIDEIAEKKE